MEKADIHKKNIPDTPGVYIFRGARRKVLYVGKATSLRSRVCSYFASDVAGARGARIKGMVEQAKSITYEMTDSVLEALIREAHLIKKHQPPFNVRDKDNKSFNYLIITKEDSPAGGFPRVLVVRGRELFSTPTAVGSRSAKKMKAGHIFGPFPQGGQLKEALKIVRKIFPYRDTCIPHVGRGCFNRQIGLCPGVCTGEISEKEYRKNIRNIALLFSGKKKELLKTLEREMKRAAREERFEDAARARRQIAALTHIRDVALIKEDAHTSDARSDIRIEAYDIAHTGGTETVGVMVVVKNGEVERSGIRRFRVRGATNNDTASLTEVLSRRLMHSEWPLPRLFVIDGGKAQVRATERALKSAGIKIPVVGVVKDEKHRPREIIGERDIIRIHEKDILLANNEAHTRAVGYHRTRVRKRMV